MAIEHATINNERELFLFIRERQKWAQDFEFTPCRFPVKVTFCETSGNCYPRVELWDEYLPEEPEKSEPIKELREIINDKLMEAHNAVMKCESKKSGPTYQYLSGRLHALVELTDEIRKNNYDIF